MLVCCFRVASDCLPPCVPYVFRCLVRSEMFSGLLSVAEKRQCLSFQIKKRPIRLFRPSAITLIARFISLPLWIDLIAAALL